MIGFYIKWTSCVELFQDKSREKYFLWTPSLSIVPFNQEQISNKAIDKIELSVISNWFPFERQIYLQTIKRKTCVCLSGKEEEVCLV